MKTGIKLLAGAVVVMLAVGASGCSRESRKRTYLERANRLASQGKYNEAALSYKQAIKLDVAFAEAHYQLALTELKLQDFDRAVLSLQRAALLMPNRMEIKAMLGRIYLDAYLSDPQRPKMAVAAVEAMASQLLAKDPNSFDGLRLKGRLAQDQGDLATAGDLLKRATSIKPLDPEATTELAEVYARQSRADEARQLAEQVIQAHQDYAPAYELVYKLYMAQGHIGDAERVLKSKRDNNPKILNYVLQLASHYAAVNKPAELQQTLQSILANPAQFPHGILSVGEFYWMRFDYPAALKSFQEGERVDPSWRAEYQKRQVNVLLALGKPDEAGSIVDAMLAANPKDREIRRSKAGLLIQSGDATKFRQGQQILQDLVREDPGDAASHFDLGRSYVPLGKLDMAKAEIQEAIHLNRMLVPARVIMAEIAQQERRYQDALDQSAKAIEVDGENFRARLLHAWALQDLGHVAQARQEMLDLTKRFPQRAEAQVAMARMEMTEGNFKQAEDKLQAMYKTGQGNTTVLRELITLYATKGQPARGLALIVEELKAHPNSEELLALHAMAAVLNGDTGLAIRQYENLLKLAPSNNSYRVALSELEYNRGNVTAAVKQMQEAVAASPGKVEYMLLLGGLLSANGRPEEARAMYRQVLKLDEMNTSAMNNLAYNLADSGTNLDEAYVLATQASQRDSSADVLDTLGWVYLKKNMTESSLKIFAELTSRYPNSPTYRYHFGMALLQKGDRAKAKTELTAALAKNPSKREEEKIRSALIN
jgi:tetratricopeptide (TPR) repeat protein